MNYFKDCQSLEDAKKHYWKLCKQYHPDVGGDTETMQEINRQFREFQPNKTNFGKDFTGTFDFSGSQEFISIVQNLVSIADFVTVEIIGDWIWVSGNTYPYKDQIKNAVSEVESYKAKFSKKKAAWYISPIDYKKKSRKQYNLDEIRSMFGSEQVEGKQANLIEA